MTFERRKPYNALPALPPRKDIETKPVLIKNCLCSKGTCRTQGLVGVIPNQAKLVNSLVLQEAKASSEIENIVTTNDALFKAMAAGPPPSDPATKEVLRSCEALWAGISRMRDKGHFDLDLIIELVQVIKKDSRGIRNKPGTS